MILKWFNDHNLVPVIEEKLQEKLYLILQPPDKDESKTFATTRK